MSDRTSVSALDLPLSTDAQTAARAGEKDALCWRSGPAFEARSVETDPEHYPRILEVAAAPDFVAVLRSDGRLALLSPVDGGVLRAHALSAPRAARMHAQPDWVALLVDTGVETRFYHVTISDGRLDERILAHARWPAWSEVTSAGLLLVRPDEIRWRTSERALDGHLALDEPLRIATLTADRNARGAAGLFFVDMTHRIRRFDAARRNIAWTVDGAGRTPVTQLVSGDGVLAVGGDERIDFLDARTGAAADVPPLVAAAGETFAAVSVSGSSREFVFATKPATSGAAAARLTLWRRVTVDDASSRAASGSAAPPAGAAEWHAAILQLDPPVVIRDVVVWKSRIVVLGAETIHVYEWAPTRG